MLAAGAAVLLEPTSVVRGYLRGEAFCRERPTSYWMRQLRAEAEAGAPDRETLVAFRRDAHGAAAVLAEALRDPDKDIRWRAAAHLARLGPNGAGALPALIQALDDPEPEVRFHAAAALWKMGRLARAALPTVTEKLNDPDEMVALMAAHAFWAIDRDAAVKRFGWQEVKSEEWGFRAMMPPDVKKETVINDMLGDGKTPVAKFSAADNGAFFVVAVSEPLVFNEAGELTGDERLEAIRAKSKLMPLVRQLKEETFVLHGRKGYEFLYQMETNQEVYMRLRVFCVDRRVYTMLVSGFGENMVGTPTEYFFASFRLLTEAQDEKERAP